ncbi:patatin-like phospholipase family protein [Ruminococcus flavefaciens]|uniref:Predicted phospholipase, patatin/cPLA2 family n=1 Tax=Ruminococcus flavefaciens TaxID=1265 RepID=A0A1K1LIU0_RUMFL|nr:patatin family protein [Ruminococcus flavefaciens]SFW10791.1 Predicted phospholipase, patatin/cPLA2 family [Ruminococcus flavefaciens]
MKYGLVLEGGAMRGLFTAGVIDVFMENGITFDAAVGVSAGAAFGCNYKSGQIRRAIRYNTRFCKDKRYCSVNSLIKTGDMFGGEFCYHTVPDKLDLVDVETFNNSPMDFWVVCTDITTGKAIYHKCGHICYDEMEWFRASASMPLAARIVEVGGYRMLDGGIADSIPLKFMESRGCEKNVVIVTQPRDYVKKPAGAQKLIKLKYHKYPELRKAIANRHKMYNGELKYIRSAEEAGRAFVIAPPEALPIGHIEHDPEVMLEVYRIGRRIANENLEAVKEFLELNS